MSGAPSLLVALVLPTAAGWGIVGLLDRVDVRSPAAIAGRLALALLVGIGLSSLLAFGTLLAGGALGSGYVLLDAIVLAALAAGAGWAAHRRGASPRSSPRPPISIVDLAAGVVLLVAFGLSVWAFASATAAQPHGEWDAWAIWNHRARFLLRAGVEWRRAFAPELSWSQLEYPLLVPLSVARLWAYGGETPLAPAILAGAFTFSATIALGGAVARAAGNLAGAIAALVLLATAQFTVVGAMQYADVPIAALFVAGLGALVQAGAAGSPSRAGRFALAGVLFGLAGWTKNEGIAAAGCAIVAYLATSWRTRGKHALSDLLPMAAGAALPAAAWIAFHVVLVPRLATALAQDAHALDRLLDASRWRLVLSSLASVFPGGKNHVPALAVLLALAAGARPRGLLRSVPLLAGVLLLGADVLAYVLTPQDLAWHLGTSADRVLVHAWPALLLGLFAAAAQAPASARLPELTAELVPGGDDAVNRPAGEAPVRGLGPLG